MLELSSQSNVSLHRHLICKLKACRVTFSVRISSFWRKAWRNYSGVFSRMGPTPEILKDLALHSLLRWRMIILLILTPSLIHLSLKGWENVRFELGNERVHSKMRSTPMLFLFLVSRSAVLSLHPSSSTCSRLCFVGCLSKEFICIARLPVCLPCTSTWRCATRSPGVGSLLRTRASDCGFYGTAEIRFSAIRSPRFWVSGYCTKWRIQGSFHSSSSRSLSFSLPSSKTTFSQPS